MKIRVGTRGSKLALAQTKQIILQIEAKTPDCECEIKIVQTTGDQRQKTATGSVNDKEEWLRGLDTALLNDEIDIAVHSAKDVPVQVASGTKLTALGERASSKDVFVIGKSQLQLEELPDGAVIGTSSLRRQAQLLNFNPKLKVVNIRGNVDTRIKKLAQSKELSGIILAEAGINRLSLNLNYQALDSQILLPAMNQGNLAAQLKEDRPELEKLLTEVTSEEVRFCFEAERKVIRMLEADCSSALGVLAEVDKELVRLKCRVYSLDGQTVLAEQGEVHFSQASQLAASIADKLLVSGAKELLHN